MWQKIGKLLNAFESRWSLWTLVNGTGVVAFGAVPAWAVKSMEKFAEYQPLSWVIALFAGVLFWTIVRMCWIWIKARAIRGRYDAKMLEVGAPINPTDTSFQNKRIYIEHLALPSNPFIQGKTFINCDIVGPASVFFGSNNTASATRLPIVDGVWIEQGKQFTNGYIFHGCTFINCSFQRITIFVSAENYALDAWRYDTMINWICPPPTNTDGE